MYKRRLKPVYNNPQNNHSYSQPEYYVERTAENFDNFIKE